MGKSHRKSELDRARDELMSHCVRCEVLEADIEHRMEWLEDTMGFMEERYPNLSDLQFAQLEMMGRQFLRPAIPHGNEHSAQNRREKPLNTPAVNVETGTPVEEQAPKDADTPIEAEAPGEDAEVQMA